jgi:hypothetical protein
VEEEKMTPSYPVFKPVILPDFHIGDDMNWAKQKISKMFGQNFPSNNAAEWSVEAGLFRCQSLHWSQISKDL